MDQSRKGTTENERSSLKKNHRILTSSSSRLKMLYSKISGSSEKEINEKISFDTDNQINLNKEESKVSSLYKRILEDEEGMDWETFQQLVEALHPAQRELWKDVCKVVKNEAKRVSGTEVCIEVKPITKNAKISESEYSKDADEISFELDMKLEDVEDFFEKRLRSCLINKKLKTIKMQQRNI